MSIVVDMTPERAEVELLYLLRLQDASSFALSVTCSDGRWTVISEDLDGIAGRAIGEGSCFAEAWFTQKPEWARRET
jgi:hypothetical protein